MVISILMELTLVSIISILMELIEVCKLSPMSSISSILIIFWFVGVSLHLEIFIEIIYAGSFFPICSSVDACVLRCSNSAIAEIWAQTGSIIRDTDSCRFFKIYKK